MAEDELHLLFQQMGEVLVSIRALHETIELRQSQAEQLQDLVRSELAVLRQDQRALEEKMAYASFITQRDLGALFRDTAENTKSIELLVASIDALRRPISDIVALKSRLAGLIFGAGLVGSAVLWLAEPVYRWLLDMRLLRQ